MDSIGGINMTIIEELKDSYESCYIKFINNLDYE